MILILRILGDSVCVAPKSGLFEDDIMPLFPLEHGMNWVHNLKGGKNES